MIRVNIKPKQIFLDDTKPWIVRLDIFVSDIHFNDGITFTIREVCEDETLVVPEHKVTISGDDYNNWIGTDQFIIDLMCKECSVKFESINGLTVPTILESDGDSQ